MAGFTLLTAQHWPRAASLSACGLPTAALPPAASPQASAVLKSRFFISPPRPTATSLQIPVSLCSSGSLHGAAPLVRSIEFRALEKWGWRCTKPRRSSAHARCAHLARLPLPPIPIPARAPCPLSPPHVRDEATRPGSSRAPTRRPQVNVAAGHPPRCTGPRGAWSVSAPAEANGGGGPSFILF
jgi:hypothetical protein